MCIQKRKGIKSTEAINTKKKINEQKTKILIKIIHRSE